MSRHIARAIIHLAWIGVALLAAKTGNPLGAGFCFVAAVIAPIIIINGKD